MNKELLFKLCELGGVSGGERSVADFAAAYLSEFAEVSVDCNNNVIAVSGYPEASRTVLLDAHIDRIGFIVTGITDDGFIRVDKCGGVDLRTAPGAPVIIHGREDINGIICCMPPHLSDGKEDEAVSIDNVIIDPGLPSEKVKELVSEGDFISFFSKPKELIGDRVCAAALDNRAGVCALLRVNELIKDIDLDCRVITALTCQEETYAAGAKTTAFKYKPDECICVDVSFASQPGISGMYATIRLGEGPMLLVSPTLSRHMYDSVGEVCEFEGIDYQLEIVGGKSGTNADSITVSGAGVKSAVISIPEKNMHTQAEIVSLTDIENTARLIALYLEKGGTYFA